MSEAANIKTELTQSLKALHLPTIRQSYEEVARQAEREALSYERYLHELVERECEERQENRTSKMLRESQLPLEVVRHKVCKRTRKERRLKTPEVI